MRQDVEFSFEEAQVGARKALENARRLERSSELLADRQEFGPAVGLLVLATEAAVKALFFALHIVNVRIPPDEVHMILRQHKTRHAIAALHPFLEEWAEETVTQQVEGMREELEALDVGEEDSVEPDESVIATFGSLFRGIWDQLEQGRPDVAEDEGELSKEGEWWLEADSLKMRGFYVDPTENGWKFPSDLSEATYSEAVRYASPFIERVAKDVEIMQSMPREGRELLNEILLRSVDSDLNELVESLKVTFFEQ